MTAVADGAKSKDTGSSESSTDKYVISEIQLGVWKVFIATQKRAQGLLAEIWDTYPLIIQIIVDIYTVSPRLLYLLMLTVCWNGVELALHMRLENMLLAQVRNAVVNLCHMLTEPYKIELAVSTGKADVYTTVLALGCKVLHSIVASYVRWCE